MGNVKTYFCCFIVDIKKAFTKNILSALKECVFMYISEFDLVSDSGSWFRGTRAERHIFKFRS